MLYRTRVKLAMHSWVKSSWDQVLVQFSPTAGKGVIISRVTFFVHVIIVRCFEHLALSFVLQTAYYSLLKSRCEANCIEALSMPGGPLEAHWRPIGVLL